MLFAAAAGGFGPCGGLGGLPGGGGGGGAGELGLEELSEESDGGPGGFPPLCDGVGVWPRGTSAFLVLWMGCDDKLAADVVAIGVVAVVWVRVGPTTRLACLTKSARR